ncbi:hypothetical protein ABT120_40575 [Nonomuraea angiospora]|uniref:hypothetical protein n=1 Tax=Nonomuraea angiospora TaxID=46172 RepID=UPI00331C517D
MDAEMDEMTALRQMGERLGPTQVVPGAQVEAAVRARTGRGARLGRVVGRRLRWGVPLAAAAAVAVVAVTAHGLLLLGAHDGTSPAAPPATTAGRPATAEPAADPPLAAAQYVYTRVRFVERAHGGDKGWVESTGIDESWASADGRGAAVQHNGVRRPAGESSYSVMRPGWHVTTQLSADMRAGKAGQDLRGDVRLPWMASPGVMVPALPIPATVESVEGWLTQIEQAAVGDNPRRVAALRAPTWAFGPGNQPEAVDVFALIPPSAREAVFQAVSRRAGATRSEVTVQGGRRMIAIDGAGGGGMGDDPWQRMLFDPVSHAFMGIQDLLPDAEDGAKAGTVVNEYLIEQQAVVDRPGRLPDHSILSVRLTPSDLPAADPAWAYLGK